MTERVAYMFLVGQVLTVVGAILLGGLPTGILVVGVQLMALAILQHFEDK